MLFLRKSNRVITCVLSILGLNLAPNAAFGEDLGRPDLLSFANGALPILAESSAAGIRVDMEHAISVIDGNPVGFVAHRKLASDGDTLIFQYALPSMTTFDAFFVPNVTETPSPSQTFFKNVAVLGSSVGPEGPFVSLASVELETHGSDDQRSALTLEASQPAVGWIQVELSGGIDVQRDQSFFEFSELIGHGQQQVPELASGFDGVWSGRGVKLELEQDRATVSGCYDNDSLLQGTVEGNVLRALGQNPAGIKSQFILQTTADGSIRGLRSTNGAPFKPYDGDVSGKAPKCLAPEPPKLGCGSVIHGISFDYDSADIRPSSQPVISDLFEGLSQSGSVAIELVGHSSSEGSANYNRDLSERRAQSVVSALVALGLNETQLTASGRGEDDPIASNDHEAGRSLNRRVEILCRG